MSDLTHKVVVEVSSVGDSPEVHMEVRWNPADDGGVEEMGYVPAAFMFVQQCLLAAELASVDGVEIEEGDLDDTRTIN